MLADLNTQEFAFLLFGVIVSVFLFLVFLFGPKELPSWKKRIIAIITAIISGLTGIFLTGRINFVANLNLTELEKSTIQAGGGFALFTIVLFWWLPEFRQKSWIGWEYIKKGFKEIRLGRSKWEKFVAKQGKSLEMYPDAKLMMKLNAPKLENQREGLIEIIDKMDSMDDLQRSKIIYTVGYYGENSLQPERDKNNYNLFRLIMEKVTRFDPVKNSETWDYFLCILSNILNMPPKGNFTRQVQKDMIGLLKEVIRSVDKKHVSEVETIIENSMGSEKDEHEVARSVLSMILDLDIRKHRYLCKFIFDRAKKRAVSFPQSFGFDFLSVVWRLEHRVFWLDYESLRNILVESTSRGEEGLISSQQEVYKEIKILEPDNVSLDFSDSSVVFRKLEGESGKSSVRCTCHGQEGGCECVGEELSLSSFISRECEKKAGEEFLTEITLNSGLGLKLKGLVTRRSNDRNGKVPEGREIRFEDEVNEGDVKELYKYILRETVGVI